MCLQTRVASRIRRDHSASTQTEAKCCSKIDRFSISSETASSLNPVAGPLGDWFELHVQVWAPGLAKAHGEEFWFARFLLRGTVKSGPVIDRQLSRISTDMQYFSKPCDRFTHLQLREAPGSNCFSEYGYPCLLRCIDINSSSLGFGTRDGQKCPVNHGRLFQIFCPQPFFSKTA
jgi:hypothetical protein